MAILHPSKLRLTAPRPSTTRSGANYCILGFVLIGAGIALTDGLIKSITDDHEEFRSVAGYAKFVLYAIFLIIGTGGIFATFPGVTNIIANVSWAFAVAFAIILIPIAYAIAKKMSKET